MQENKDEAIAIFCCELSFLLSWIISRFAPVSFHLSHLEQVQKFLRLPHRIVEAGQKIQVIFKVEVDFGNL